MAFQLFIAVLLGAVGSYISFFKPKILSENIEELKSIHWKWSASSFSFIIAILLIYLINPNTLSQWIEYGFLMGFYFIAIVDVHSKIIPNRLVIILLIISILKLVTHFEIEFVVASGCVFVSLVVINLLTNKFLKKNLFGWGDVKLLAVLGLYSGWEVLWIMYISIIFAGLLSIIGIISKKISSKTKIPFAMFIFFGLNSIIYVDLIPIFINNSYLIIKLVYTLVVLIVFSYLTR